MITKGMFQIFGPHHLWTFAIIFLIAVCFVGVARNRTWQQLVKPLCWSLATILICNELIFVIVILKQGLWSYTWALPLNLCDLAIFAIAFCLIRHHQFLWELAYFWGLGGTLQAILTPDLATTFPDYTYIKFFLTHGCILVGVITLSVGLKRPIRKGSVQRVFIATNIYALVIGMFNFAFKTNYAYLCEKPSQASIIDFLGPWPFYILGLEVLLIVSLLVYYLPYYFINRKKQSFT